MALRIKMSAEATERMLAARKRARITAISVAAVLVVLGSILMWVTSILIKAPEEALFIVYTPADDTTDLAPKPVTSISGGSPPTAPPIDVIVSTDAASVAMPTMDLSSVIDGSMFGSSMGGMDGIGGGGLGNGFGGGNGSGMGSSKSEGSSFCGRFWDLKKTSSGAPSVIGKNPTTSNSQVLEIESRFFNSMWSPNMFSSYYESKVKLFTTCFFMPNCLDNEASHAYDPKGKMGLQPSRWVALYRAKVKAPTSGRFRFVGAADSVMGVRFNGKNVLECGFHNLRTAKWNGNLEDTYRNGKDFYQYRDCDRWNELFGGFQAGDVFEVKEGEWYEMEVLISEIGGGEFGFCLLLDDVDGKKRKDKDGNPIFQLFRTNLSMPDVEEIYAGIKFKDKDEGTRVRPPFDDDSMVWEAKPIGGGN